MAPPKALKAAAGGSANGLKEDCLAAWLDPSSNTEIKKPTQDLVAKLSRKIDEAFPPNWSECVVENPFMQRWRDELAFRIWKHKALLHRIGCVGPDWELLKDELTAFTYINQNMAREIARREPPKAEEAA